MEFFNLGGTTIFENGPELEQLLEIAKKKIIQNISFGLYPDTDLIAVCEEKKIYDVYRIKLIPNPGNPRDVLFTKSDSGDIGRAIASAKYFAERYKVPKSDFIVCVHLHT